MTKSSTNEEPERCGCGANEWVLDGGYTGTRGRRQRVRCRRCGVSPIIERRSQAKKRKRTIDRQEFWEAVFRHFPGLRLTAALDRAGHLVGGSAALRSQMIGEVLDGTVELPRTKDGREALLKECLIVYRLRESPPRPAGFSSPVRLEDEDAKKFWRAFTRARGIASLVHNSRDGSWKRQAEESGSISLENLRAGRPHPMPVFWDLFAPGADTWRLHYPLSAYGGSFEHLSGFAERLKASTPAHWWWTMHADEWLERWKAGSRLRWLIDIVERRIGGESSRPEGLFLADPAPVPDPVAFAEIFETEVRRTLKHPSDPGDHDARVDAGLRYTLELTPGSLVARVSTRRVVVGKWREELRGDYCSGIIRVEPRFVDPSPDDIEAGLDRLMGRLMGRGSFLPGLGDIEVQLLCHPWGEGERLLTQWAW